MDRDVPGGIAAVAQNRQEAVSVMGAAPRRVVGFAAVAALALGVLGAVPAAADPGRTPNSSASPTARGHVAVCGPAGPDSARCHSDLLTIGGRVVTSASAPVPGSYGPADLRSAYNLPSSMPVPQTVAIVDAYNDPYAESDMAVYRSKYGISPCTSTTGCFRKVNQSGSTSYPRNNGSWSQEISLDLDMVSAACPGCHILLVEANSATYGNLGAAVNTAVRLGATEVTNSYGGSEFSSEPFYDSYYNHPGVAITASSGDNGYGVEYPAASPFVTSVGGTSLTRATNTARGWSETTWSGAGSGCSSYEPNPSWQLVCGGGHRIVADVSAVADPNTGVAVYDSYAYQGYSGWLVFGGTSVASPIIASTYALAGNAATVNYGSYPYSHPGSLYDITSGRNSSSGCTPSYLCTAGPGYDGPTGNGTPNGMVAF